MDARTMSHATRKQAETAMSRAAFEAEWQRGIGIDPVSWTP